MRAAQHSGSLHASLTSLTSMARAGASSALIVTPPSIGPGSDAAEAPIHLSMTEIGRVSAINACAPIVGFGAVPRQSGRRPLLDQSTFIGRVPQNNTASIAKNTTGGTIAPSVPAISRPNRLVT